ncbi:MAG TPA: hypothetical protein ENJ00_11835, partial [Phycisphaerales bacterium]|nr:hypothetical protein [Phycisphaerales bacterium]
MSGHWRSRRRARQSHPAVPCVCSFGRSDSVGPWLGRIRCTMPEHDQSRSDQDQTLDRMYRNLAHTGLTLRLFELARDEDLGPEVLDRTAAICRTDAARALARIILGEDAYIAGLAAIPEMIEVFGGGVRFEPRSADGSPARAGDCIGQLIGPIGSIVTIERPILNLLGRLSGVASRTARFVEQAGPRVEVLDTRKTTPGLRVLEKYAVRCGGGSSHRLGLYDAVMIKDNHIA